MYFSGREYKNRLHINMETKRSLYLRSEWHTVLELVKFLVSLFVSISYILMFCSCPKAPYVCNQAGTFALFLHEYVLLVLLFHTTGCPVLYIASSSTAQAHTVSCLEACKCCDTSRGGTCKIATRQTDRGCHCDIHLPSK